MLCTGDVPPVSRTRGAETVTVPFDATHHDRTFPTLDAVRAAGALMVVCTHVAFNTGRINHGWTGAVLPGSTSA